VPIGDSLGIRPLTLGRHISTVTERHFSLANEKGDSERGTPEGATPMTDYGGISGSAVYVMTPDQTLILADFKYKSHADLYIRYVTIASHINADGTIRFCD
jgi:hypothetical protein